MTSLRWIWILLIGCGLEPSKNFRGGAVQAALDALPEAASGEPVALTIQQEHSLHQVRSIDLPESFAPQCLSSSSQLTTGLVLGNGSGIRQPKMEALLGRPLSSIPEEQDGWMVETYPDATAESTLAQLAASSAYSVAGLGLEAEDLPEGLADGPFALAIKANAKVPIGRTLFFRIQANGVARVYLNDELFLASDGTTEDSIELMAGVHDMRIEYFRNDEDPSLSLEMRLDNETDYEVAASRGVLSLSNLIQPESEEKDPTRPALWPLIPGTEHVVDCRHAFARTGEPRQSFIDNFGFLVAEDQVVRSVRSPFPAEEVRSFWVGFPGDILTSLSVSENQLGIGLTNSQLMTVDLDGVLKSDDQVRILGVGYGSVQNGTRFVLHGTQDDQSLLANIDIRLQNSQLQTRRFKAPSLWGKEIQPLVNFDEFSLLATASGLVASKHDGSEWLSIESPEGYHRWVASGESLALIKEDGSAYLTLSLEALETSLQNAFSGETNPIPASANLTDPNGALSLQPDQQSVWLDAWGQLWILEEGRLTIWAETNRPFLYFNSANQSLLTSDPGILDKIEVETSDGKSAIDLADVMPLGYQLDRTVDSSIIVSFRDGTTRSIAIGANSSAGTILQGPTEINDPGTSPSPEPTVSYAEDLAPLIERSCLGVGGNGCHSRPNPAAGAPLETAVDLRNRITGVIGAAGPAGNMPLGGRTPFSADELQLFMDWQEQNFPD